MDKRNMVERAASRKNKGRCYRCGKRKPWKNLQACKKCTLMARASCLRSVRDLKKEIIEAYGKVCACCGEKEADFLSIDHKRNNGAAHRKEITGNSRYGGQAVYRWLRNRGFPKKDYQLLCFNCNMAKSIFGVCPHRRKHDRTRASKR